MWLQSLTGSQNSVPLQNIPSSGQLASLAMLSQESVPSLHESSVQPTPSSQSTAVPGWQSSVAWQVSVPLQYRPSSQLASLGTLSHESVLSLHESSVQPTPSSQSTAVPGWQSAVAWHHSSPSQYKPLSQLASLGMLSHESVPSLHESSVQPTPSSQSTATPGWQSAVAWHHSSPSQYRPLSQCASLGMLSHESVPSLHESSVQPTLSSQSTAVPG